MLVAFCAEVGWLIGVWWHFSTSRLYHAMDVSNILFRAGDTHIIKTKIFVEIISYLERCHHKCLSTQSHGKYWQLNQNTKGKR